ncbi:glycine cleavage system H protein [Elysia marginata]|uniref:Glycine cleavage system H protein n=1 Tax=Elysia marginata TaxID=1093978 RepID=A0AAV4G5X7_9GAST|nr:glycine cleavage system H protein [Elysia marginata]
MTILDDLKYSKDHEWVRMEANVATIGITDFAQSELGDIVYIEVEAVGEILETGDIFGSVEAVKAVSDLFLPVSGKILEFNEAINDSPDKVNRDPYGEGWIIKVEIETKENVSNLLSAESYKELIGA